MEKLVSQAIISNYQNKLLNNLDIDVAIAGGGPSGMVAGYFLSKAGFKVALFDQKLAPGGGMWGGAMLYNKIVIQEDAQHILEEFGITIEDTICKDKKYFVVDSIQATSALIYKATSAGTAFFNSYSVEDVVLKKDTVCGVVVNWAPVVRTQMHVDPLVIMAKAVLDATGHPSEICHILSRKNNVLLNTESGKIMGEQSMSMAIGEETTLINTQEAFPGLYVSGMAANGVFGSFRMGPIFGGMLLSGEKVFQLIKADLEKKNV